MTKKEQQKQKKSKDIAWHFLITCKQVHVEATPYVYQKNLFPFSFHKRFAAFTTDYHMHVPHLRRVHVWLLIDHKGGLATDVQAIFDNPALVNLYQLDVIVDTNAETLEEAAEKFYDAARNWIQAIGQRDGDDYAVLNVLSVTGVMFKKDTSVVQEKNEEFLNILGDIMAKDFGDLDEEGEEGEEES